MSTNLEYGNSKIDKISQEILDVLKEGPCRTGELVDETEVNQHQQIHHRMEEYLVPAGLVQELGEAHVPGGLPNGIVWSLTDKGYRFVDDFDDEILRPEVEDLENRVQNLENKIKAHQERLQVIDGKRGHLNSLQQDLEERHASLDELNELLDDVEEHVEQVKESHAAVLVRGDKLERAHEEVRQKLSEQDEHLQEIQQEWNQVQSQINNEISEYSARVEEDLKEIETYHQEVRNFRKQMDDLPQEAHKWNDYMTGLAATREEANKIQREAKRMKRYSFVGSVIWSLLLLVIVISIWIL